MIGLRRGTVKLAPHSKKWKLDFEREKRVLEEKLGGLVLDIQHIGSTAVPDMVAKPIIDISLGIRNFKNANKLIEPLSKIGYNFYRNSKMEIFFAKGPDAKRTHYLHIMKYNSAKWKNDLLFRDYLRSHPARIRQYAKLKKELAKKYTNTREKYTDGKKKFILETLRAARET